MRGVRRGMWCPFVRFDLFGFWCSLHVPSVFHKFSMILNDIPNMIPSSQCVFYHVPNSITLVLSPLLYPNLSFHNLISLIWLYTSLIPVRYQLVETGGNTRLDTRNVPAIYHHQPKISIEPNTKCQASKYPRNLKKPIPQFALWRMDGKWSGTQFSVGFQFPT